MTILLEALNRVRDLVNADIDKGQFGTGTTAAAESDTGLQTPDSNTLLALDSTTVVSKGLKFEYTNPSTSGTTGTYHEFELQKSTATVVNYDRVLTTGIPFTLNGSEDIKVTKRYFFKGV